jgi:hypothetical protein
MKFPCGPLVPPSPTSKAPSLLESTLISAEPIPAVTSVIAASPIPSLFLCNIQ